MRKLFGTFEKRAPGTRCPMTPGNVKDCGDDDDDGGGGGDDDGDGDVEKNREE